MKTALQQLIEDLNSMKNNEVLSIAQESIHECLITATSYIETEKQQIIDAYHDGQEHGFNKFGNDAEKYFEDTFNLKQEL